MAFLSKLYGKQVNKATILAAHSGVGAMLTFDSSAKFPTPSELILDNCLCGYITSNREEIDPDTGVPKDSIPEYFNYKDTSTRNMYVDATSNIMYRWKHYTIDEWGADHWEYDNINKKWIIPDKPLRENYDTNDEYNEALSDWNSLQYPTYIDINDKSIVEAEGYTYVACAGGGGSDLYWTKL
jgi:hypothetical protein